VAVFEVFTCLGALNWHWNAMHRTTKSPPLAICGVSFSWY